MSKGRQKWMAQLKQKEWLHPLSDILFFLALNRLEDALDTGKGHLLYSACQCKRQSLPETASQTY